MVFKNLCVFMLWMKVASALERLSLVSTALFICHIIIMIMRRWRGRTTVLKTSNVRVSYQAGDEHVAPSHGGQLQPLPLVAGIEKQDAPEDVEEEETQGQECCKNGEK